MVHNYHPLLMKQEDHGELEEMIFFMIFSEQVFFISILIDFRFSFIRLKFLLLLFKQLGYRTVFHRIMVVNDSNCWQ